MNVYRYMCEAELQAFLSGNTEDVGTCYYGEKVSNTHKYEPDEKYLHFFFNLRDLQHIRNLKRDEEGSFYIGVFDLPLRTLAFAGKGYYETRGYDVPYEVVREIAVDVKKIEPSSLVYYAKDTNRDITKEEIKEGLKEGRPLEDLNYEYVASNDRQPVLSGESAFSQKPSEQTFGSNQ